MRTIHPSNLINKKTITIEIPSEIIQTFNTWKKLKTSENKKLKEEEIFYAGYILSNPIIRDEYKKLNKEKY